MLVQELASTTGMFHLTLLTQEILLIVLYNRFDDYNNYTDV